MKIKAVGRLNKLSYNTDGFSKKKLNSPITNIGIVQTGRKKKEFFVVVVVPRLKF